MLSLSSFEKQVIFSMSDSRYLVYVLLGQNKSGMSCLRQTPSPLAFWGTILLLKIFLSGGKKKAQDQLETSSSREAKGYQYFGVESMSGHELLNIHLAVLLLLVILYVPSPL